MNITIDEKSVQVAEPISILGAIGQAGARLQAPDCGPARDWTGNPDCPAIHLAEVDGVLVSSVILKSRGVTEGMRIRTVSPEVDRALEERTHVLKDRQECFFIRQMQNVLAAEAASAGHIDVDEWLSGSAPLRLTEPAIVHDPSRCLRCQRCVETCREIQAVDALRFDEAEGVLVDEKRCVRCGQCIHVCPSGAPHKYSALLRLLGCQSCPFDRPLGAMREKDETVKAWSILHSPESYPVAQFAPAVRASLAQEFGIDAGELMTGKIYAALRRLGFKQVWDTNFSADLTIMEEGSELLARLEKPGTLPMFTSCSPGWVRFAETFYPDLLPHLSTAKSPQQMLGAVAKSFATLRLNIDPRCMKVVSFMPCTAKKDEAARPEMDAAFRFLDVPCEPGGSDPFPDVDLVLTTRELARLLKMSGIDLRTLPEENADPLLGAYTGAAPIFGRTGGVMEAALRTAAVLVTGVPLAQLEFGELRTMKGIKTATVELDGTKLKVAVAHGLANARKVCDSVRSGGEFASYHFIEFMACPGGCVAGGGQPIPTNDRTISARTKGLNRDDSECCSLHMSHENPEIKSVYAEFLREPLSHVSHALLHTTYTDRSGESGAA
jgi:iron-only hydrogenase group A